MSDRRLRFVRPEDAAAILSIYDPIVRETSISFEMEVPDEEEIQRRIAAVTAHYPWIVCESEGRVLGYAYATAYRARAAYRWTAESSVYVHADARGRGVARELMGSLIDLLRTLGYRTLVAGLTLPNEASERLHESLGFSPAGTVPRAGRKFGSWHDVFFCSLDLGAIDGETPPRSVDVLEGRLPG
ncbi:MAG: N-acetyltransferase family protein [Planctomycetota bacterium]